ncbi:Pycsar system effector family protein [Rapidithrix thailandica]|uniref:Pycsar system effector family protein n=1 Tax=Rapidithrix thailandica TaxID=413964 RepID=A0AAW9RYP6_9BACT
MSATFVMDNYSSPVLEKAEEYITSLFNNELPKVYSYHNLEHTQEVVKAALEIGAHSHLDPGQLEVLLLAAWFHDTGYRFQAEEHEGKSAEIAQQFLENQGYAAEKIEQVKEAILATRMPQKPKSQVEKILCDSDLYHLSSGEFFDRSSLLRKEWADACDRSYNEEDWYAYNLDFLLKHQYFTEYAQSTMTPKKEDNIKKLRKKQKKLSKKKDLLLMQELGISEEELKQLKKKLEKVKGRPERGIETMFRTTSRNHLELSAMADSKANIMISVNSIIITIIFSVLMRKLDNNPHLIVPTFLLLFVCLGSVVFAILATRPNVTQGTSTKEDIKKKQANLLFFGNFHNMKLKDFEWGMNQMLNDSNFLYGSMIKDIYYLGAVLGRKYRFLRISYTIFMFGLILASLAFVIANLPQFMKEPAFDPDPIF